jgi:hypothetical protein
MTTSDLWTYRSEIGSGTDLTGFEVEATDGSIGKIDEATYDVGGSYIVVDTGPWIFGKKVLLPAGIITRVDPNERTVWVDRTKDAIENAPEFDKTGYREEAYRTEVGRYYGPGVIGGETERPL